MMEEKILRRRHMRANRIEKAKRHLAAKRRPGWNVYRYAPSLIINGYYSRRFHIESKLYRAKRMLTDYERLCEGLRDYYDEKEYGEVPFI